MVAVTVPKLVAKNQPAWEACFAMHPNLQNVYYTVVEFIEFNMDFKKKACTKS